MFTSRSSADISAYWDNELPIDRRRALEERFSTDDRAVLARYEAVTKTLREDSIEAERLSAAEFAVWQRLQRSMPTVHSRARWWRRTVAIPVPLLASTVLLLGVLIGVLGTRDTAGHAVASVTDLAPAGTGVDVRIQVEAENTAQLLEWLNQQNQVREVRIQLPDTGPFAFQGQPAYLRSSDSGFVVEPWSIGDGGGFTFEVIDP